MKTKHLVTATLFGVVVLLIVLIYHFFDPTDNINAPKCMLKMLTGYDCPGCGCQRLLYNWANGRFIEGLRYNYFFPIGIIYLFSILLGRLIPKLHHIVTSKIAIISFITLYFAWWILRNILNI